MHVALVGCGKSKLAHAAPARDLYTGSLFRAAMFHVADLPPERVFILSAKHGLVPSLKMLEPYDVAMNDLDPSARARWGERVRAQIRAAIPAPALVDLLAGSAYADALGQLAGYRVRQPMRGLGLGKRVQYLRASRLRLEP